MALRRAYWYVPEVCRNSNLFLVIVITQAFACVITILMFQEQSLANLGFVTLYAQWVVLSFCALVCLLRNYLISLPQVTGYIILWLLFISCFLVTEVVSQMIADISGRGFDIERFAYIGLVGLILSILMLWCFVLINRMNTRSEALSEAKIQALQARIKPHFFFNTLNTISELIEVKPAQAQTSIESLAILFRAALESDSAFHTLENEINLCQRYIGLEKWRWDDKYSVKIDVKVEQSSQWLVPKLILQPLIENIFKHGTLTSGAGKVLIDVRETKNHLSFKIHNSVDADSNNKDELGMGIALDNIKERLFVLYDDQQSLKVRAQADSYTVLMQIPKRASS